jgi:hypothetical protein
VSTNDAVVQLVSGSQSVFSEPFSIEDTGTSTTSQIVVQSPSATAVAAGEGKSGSTRMSKVPWGGVLATLLLFVVFM